MLPSIFAMWRKWIQSKTCLNSLQSAFRQRKYLHESLGIKKYEKKSNLWKDSKWVKENPPSYWNNAAYLKNRLLQDPNNSLNHLTYFKVIPYNSPKEKKKQLGVTKCVLSVKKLIFKSFTRTGKPRYSRDHKL